MEILQLEQASSTLNNKTRHYKYINDENENKDYLEAFAS